MSEKIHLQVDLADPSDISAKLKEAESILGDKRRRAKQAQSDANHWDDLVTKLKSFLPRVDDADLHSGRPSPVQDLVVRIVEREGRLMRPAEVTKILRSEGIEVTSNAAVNTALYAAAEAGRLRRPKDRHYGPRPSRLVKAKK